MEPMPDTLTEARALHRRGFAIIPVPLGSKNPNRRGWQNERYTEDALDGPFNGVPGNVGTQTGVNRRVDVDNDCSEARALAPLVLPHTRCRHGRPSTRDAHY